MKASKNLQVVPNILLQLQNLISNELLTLDDGFVWSTAVNIVFGVYKI